jgi:hypothetical protein
MTELKPLTYDEHKAAEAVFCGYPPDPDWTEAARLLDENISAAIAGRAGTGPSSSDHDSTGIGH